INDQRVIYQFMETHPEKKFYVGEGPLHLIFYLEHDRSRYHSIHEIKNSEDIKDSYIVARYRNPFGSQYPEILDKREEWTVVLSSSNTTMDDNLRFRVYYVPP
ncbi:MAG: hypothetical protein KAU03_02810, partial [Candidatus Altiarchaeales archaeon]|nr:hypothetical protein [Candidatus Altiarchaeales archaeon]